MERQAAAQRNRPGVCNREPGMSAQLELEPVAPVGLELVAPVEPAGLELAPEPELVEPELGLEPEPELLALAPVPPEQLGPELGPEVAAAVGHMQPHSGQDTAAAAGPALASALDTQVLAVPDTQRPGWGSWCSH